MIKSSDYIAKFLEFQGIDTIFEMAGGMITHMLDSIAQCTSIKIVSMHHEQSTSFAADAYGRIKNKPGVAFATSGPGATNLITGIGSCYFDSSPAIFITGQVNIHEQKGSKDIRQLGFQETDIISIVKPITKAAFRVTEANDIPGILKMAYGISVSGRPGPVLIDIPMNLQRSLIEEEPYEVENLKPTSLGHFDSYSTILLRLKNAKKPIVLAGAGVRASGAYQEFIQFCELSGLPVVCSLLGIDLLPFQNEQRNGFIGSYGNRWSNLALGAADFILVLGSRLDIRQTGADTKFFESKVIVHVDCESGEINNRLTNCIAVNEDLKYFLQELNSLLPNESISSFSEWKQELQELKAQWPDINELANCNGINPNSFVHALSTKAVNIHCWLADVGNHQMWTAQSLEISNHQRFITSGGMGAMGFALPAAIGACFALQRAPICVICGDGGFQLNIQELETIRRNNLPLKIVVLNNQALGMIRQFQDSYFDSRYQSTVVGYSAPNFEAIAKAYNIEARTISGTQEIGEAVLWLGVNDINDKQPKLLQVMIDTHVNAYPKIAFGKPIVEMEPFALPIDMEGT